MNTQSPDPGKPDPTPNRKVREPAYRAAKRSDSWIVLVFKIIAFLALGTIVLIALVLGTCFLGSRH